ncbi:MAG: NAD(P)H-hydrate dehydratase [Planctomycetota bacterium]
MTDAVWQPERDDSPPPPPPERDPAGHKGTFGTVLVVGGSSTPDSLMAGAPALTARGALRAGVGLCKIASTQTVLEIALTIEPSATGIVLPEAAGVDELAPERGAPDPAGAAEAIDSALDRVTVPALGPGLGTTEQARRLVMRTVATLDRPMVLDADALNAIASTPEAQADLRAPAVLTPHPGEFRRLAASLAIDADPTDEQDRPRAAAMLAQRLGCVVLLKGSGTVVSDGLRAWRCTAGHACLATAGSGDVLTGLLAALIARSLGAGNATPPLYDLVRTAAHAHGRAGELWAARAQADSGLRAQDLADLLPESLAELRN